MNKIVLFSCALIATQLAAMDSATVAQINNNSSFDIKEVKLKVKINGKKYAIKIDGIKSGTQAEVNLADAAPDVQAIESIEILKIIPKYCVDQDGQRARNCRGRIHPTDKSQMKFIIIDEEPGVIKPSRPERIRKSGKVKSALEEEEPRLVKFQ